MDISGEHQLDVDHNIFKKRLNAKDLSPLPAGPIKQKGAHPAILLVCFPFFPLPVELDFFSFLRSLFQIKSLDHLLKKHLHFQATTVAVATELNHSLERVATLVARCKKPIGRKDGPFQDPIQLNNANERVLLTT
jgi:hypothetical protein